MAEKPKAEKPHHGRIKNWQRMSTSGGHWFIAGEFLDHPFVRGHGHTSVVIASDEKTGEIETKNSRYTLVSEGEPSRRVGFPNPGDKYRYIGKNGYDYERKEADKVLERNYVYEIQSCNVNDASHSVKLKGIKGSWNGVMFKLVEEASA